ncbi:MAG: TRAP transporter substrate-binding protein DctP [Deltaproteobacteria bacterium]|nr:TRAP transporter substrate-binding protein DctP [Deltaproteobacteria bacterium]
MKRSIASILMLLLVFAASAAFGKEPPKYNWKTATLAPDGIGWSKHMKELVFPEMEKTTKGDLKVKIYWGGVMGDEEQYLQKMKIGQLQGAGLSAQGTVMACPDMAALELPFLFRNYLETDYVRVKMARSFDKLMARNGYFLIGWIDQDFDQIYSSHRPLNTVESFRGTKFVTWYGPMEVEMLKVLGAEPIPVNVPELPAAVRSGVAEASIGPAVWVVGAQLYSSIKYVNPVKIRYSPATIILNLKTWESLPDSYRSDFYTKRMVIGFRYCNLIRKDNERFLQSMIKYGVRRTDMAPGEVKALMAKTREVWGKTQGKLYHKDFLDEIVKLLEEFRAGKRLTLDDVLAMSYLPGTYNMEPGQRAGLEEQVIKTMSEFGLKDGDIITVKRK